MLKLNISKLTNPYLIACIPIGLSVLLKAHLRKVINPTIAPNPLASPAEIT